MIFQKLVRNEEDFAQIVMKIKILHKSQLLQWYFQEYCISSSFNTLKVNYISIVRY